MPVVDPSLSAWCEIHTDRIARNLERARALVPAGRSFCAVLKADAYGHGIGHVVPIIMAQGIDCVGITSNAEALAVRQAGFGGTMIRLRAATPTEIRAAAPLDIEEQVASREVAQTLVEMAQAGHPVRAHLALNAAGMGRDGLEIGTADGWQICLEILKTLRERIVGISTHFACNLPENLRRSAVRFHEDAARVLSASGLDREDVTVHAGSSLTLISDEPVQTDMYRCGAILYGILKPELGFRPTMTVKTHVLSLQNYPAGATVGYDRACVLKRDSRVATLAAGYANGIRRCSFGRMTVEVSGTRVPVIGKVSMNTLTVDVTGLPGVSVGDEVLIFAGDPSAIRLAEAQFQTIMAELYTDWGQRNPLVID
ncbi:alanine racemase [Palleronia caenipelagi]|uniref:alanine racemase n=1 Tax=Palleronia caenipelagi TaxID=2489174 RepID=A0A547PPE1_9RHOB|nr:alanine racemase [Palleronia caenipelagi]TRD16011.1 alanine racemase [Palleronia caenipelagi]